MRHDGNSEKQLSNPSAHTKSLVSNILLFQQYHSKYPSHGYRWLNAKIRLDTGLVLSNPYAHKCCEMAGIKSKAKHYSYRKFGEAYRVYPNLLMTELNIDGPLQCIVSDMTAFYVKGIYYELTLYMDLWNNEIVSYALSSKRGDRMTYISGLNDLLELKKKFPEMQTVLHSDQGSVYASKAFNELLPMYNITHSIHQLRKDNFFRTVADGVHGAYPAQLIRCLHFLSDILRCRILLCQQRKHFLRLLTEFRMYCIFSYPLSRIGCDELFHNNRIPVRSS